ncbi:MAG: NADH-quinone oxidoreductase subunit L [Phycisphaerae bacterium]
MLLAEGWSPMLPMWLYATLPLWPLLGAIGVGLLLLTKKRVDADLAAHGDARHEGTEARRHEGHAPAGDTHGHGHVVHGHGHGDHGHAHGGNDHRSTLGYAHLPVLAGAGISALLAVIMFFDLGSLADHGAHGDGHAPANHAAEAHKPDAQKPDAHATDAHADDSHKPSDHAGAATLKPATGEKAAYKAPGTNLTIYNWISLGTESVTRNHWIGVTMYFDGLTGVMMLVVCLVALMVVIYSIGYMRDHHWHPERGYERFFAFLGLFVFSMAVLVMGGNFVLLYMGWELVGLCSYLLIGFYYKKPEATAAAKKAFIVNRIGDFGFALGIFAIYYYLGMGHAGVTLLPGENPLDYTTVFKYAAVLANTPSWFGMNAADMISMLLLCGALGKSAQFPLYVWLPDAMEGPSPVSALIHAATMVTAGVYMIARCGPLYEYAEITMPIVACIGAFGAIFAASMAMAQYDMKRIMAYSTMSQLAYMFVALACAAPDAAIFHLYTHAFFKALLFLTAGNVMHAMGGVIDVRYFSGLRSVLPKTFLLMGVGCLALAGFPGLAGFWSKDTILHAAFFSPMAERLPWLGWVMMATAAMTAYYTFRMFFLCFNGPTRFPKEAGDHPHDMPSLMLAPLCVLAFGAVFAGYLGVAIKAGATSFLGVLYPHGYFHHYLHGSTIHVGPHGEGGAWVMYLSIGLGLGGIALAYLRYGNAPQDEPDRKVLGPLWDLWNAKYYVDELFDRIFVRPLRGLGEGCLGTDRFGINGVIAIVASIPLGLGLALRSMQQGALQTYAGAMVIGIGVLALVWKFSA